MRKFLSSSAIISTSIGCFILLSGILFPLYTHGQTTTAEQTAATFAQAAQSQSTSAARYLAAVQQCASQNNTSCEQTDTAAAVTAAQTAQTNANGATQSAQANPSDSAIQLSATQAATAAVAAENSAAQAGTVSGNQTVVQQMTAAANQEATTAHLSAGATAQSAVAAGAPASVVPQTTTAGTVPAGSNFIPLTALPGISTVAGSTNFIALFNNLYKVCIGLAAFLALLEIIFAGALWMTAGDNSEQISGAKKRISNAILGLLLVLSPVIVFGIINPNVLSLNLNVTALTPTQTAPAAGSTSIPISATAVSPGSASASSGVAAGQTCSTTNNSDGGCAGNLICTNGKCAADPQLDNGNGTQGAACNSAAPNCGSGLVCDSTGTCNPGVQASGSVGASGVSSGGAVNANGNTGS